MLESALTGTLAKRKSSMAQPVRLPVAEPRCHAGRGDVIGFGGSNCEAINFGREQAGQQAAFAVIEAVH